MLFAFKFFPLPVPTRPDTRSFLQVPDPSRPEVKNLYPSDPEHEPAVGHWTTSRLPGLVWRRFDKSKPIFMDFLQDPEVPEAVKQFEALVADGAGERNTLLKSLQFLRPKRLQTNWRWGRGGSPSFCTRTRGGGCHGKGSTRFFCHVYFFSRISIDCIVTYL